MCSNQLSNQLNCVLPETADLLLFHAHFICVHQIRYTALLRLRLKSMLGVEVIKICMRII